MYSEENTSLGKLLKVKLGYATHLCITFTRSDAKTDEECRTEGVENEQDVAPIKTGRSCFPKSSCCYGRNEEDSGDKSIQPKTKRSCFSSKCCGGDGKQEEAVEESIQLQPQG